MIWSQYHRAFSPGGKKLHPVVFGESCSWYTVLSFRRRGRAGVCNIAVSGPEREKGRRSIYMPDYSGVQKRNYCYHWKQLDYPEYKWITGENNDRRGCTPLQWFDRNPEIFENVIGMIPLRRLGNIKELSGLIVCLASEISNDMTGSTIIIDGGYTIW